MQVSLRFTGALVLALMASWVEPPSAEAQALRQNGVPAEQPPSDFTGNQYVDSRGCVFVRAGVNGNTNWVPRVTRERKLVCGFQPTLTEGERHLAAPSPEVIRIVPDPEPEIAQTAPIAATAPTPMSKPVVASEPRPVPVRVASITPVSNQPAQVYRRSVAVKPVTPTVETAPKQVVASKSDVLPARVASRKPRRGQIVRQGQVTGDVRVMPRHVFRDRGEFAFKPPAGYASTWDDDRLNPYRTDQTFAGKAKMDALWTQTVPRRLRPGVGSALAEASATKPATKTVIASKNAPSERVKPTADLHAEPRHVRIAAYKSAKDAQAVAQRIKKLGMPVYVGKVQSQGGDYRIVIAGPFATKFDAQAAVQRAHAAGYSNARLR